MDNEQPHQELVKCVVVGDTAVGKTRLICARACNKHVSLSQLLTTHVPTVWAIDQYRIYKDVLERSWEVVDGVNVSLRLWDTFGDHDKDRRFAYGRSDVVLLCFSITNPASLRHCATVWYPEIRKFCPSTPILLVGCKNDLRYMYRDETYLSYFKERSPFVRAARKCDLVMPDQARAIAHDLGIYYYETSVFTYYGVNQVFENAIRAALIARRQQTFWITNLKRVQRPLLQAPFMPPRPPEPEINITSSTYLEDLATMYSQKIYTDVLILTGDQIHAAHSFMLAATSAAFYCLLSADLYKKYFNRSSSESSMISTMGEATHGDFNEDTEKLLSKEMIHTKRVWEQIKRRASCQLLPSTNMDLNQEFYREIKHPAFKSIRIVKCEGKGVSPTQTIISMSKLISNEVMTQCLNFVYTGAIDNAAFGQEIKQASIILGFYELTKLMNTIQQKHHLIDKEDMQRFHNPIRDRFRDMFIEGDLFIDITFELDDGEMTANKAMLMARCEPMRAMFRGHFRESTASVISFPGVTTYTFDKFLSYVYTDELPPVRAGECVELLELANRLCMERLLNLTELRVTQDLERFDHTERTELCIALLETAKLHNASGLFAWASWTICGSYGPAAKHLKHLSTHSREYLSEHRWPPVWYLKEFDYYQKCVRESDKETRTSSTEEQTQHNGCLCFSGRKRSSECPATPASRLVLPSDTSLYQEPIMPF